jgi:4a-hydroxytetrahydrobiopterin dehydratase
MTCSLDQLRATHCAPCEGGVAPLTPSQALDQLKILDGWQIDAASKSISKRWNKKNFVKALAFCQRIGDLAEAEQHHPDLHLTGYRHLEVVITTHAIGGLSINDFILAAKIDALDSNDSPTVQP